MNQFHIHDFYIIGFIFKAQINLMRFKKKFKVSEILCVTSFDTICIFSFDTKRVHCTMETPSKYNYKYLNLKK
jgi:hypothetical protein